MNLSKGINFCSNKRFNCKHYCQLYATGLSIGVMWKDTKGYSDNL